LREPEPEIVDRARSGDLVAFASLIRDAQADVWRFAYHLTRNRAVADDVTQEAFLRAFRSIQSYRGQAKFSSWLLRIARNCAIDAYRRTRHEAPMPAEEGDRAVPSQTAASDDRLRIEAAIRQLPLDLREPFIVIEVLGFTYQEASTVLGVKVGTVKSRMFRARAALVRALSEGEQALEM
jgi:RNA polymerase sigma-70 factor (ECF subfamily)